MKIAIITTLGVVGIALLALALVDFLLRLVYHRHQTSPQIKIVSITLFGAACIAILALALANLLLRLVSNLAP